MALTINDIVQVSVDTAAMAVAGQAFNVGLIIGATAVEGITDRVTIYANTTVLGRVHIGHDSVIGGNLWITHDIAPCSTIRQPKPVRGVNTIHHEPDSERQP